MLPLLVLGMEPESGQPDRIAELVKLLKRYLDNHCANADAEGMSALCECQLCLDTRKVVMYAANEVFSSDGKQ